MKTVNKHVKWVGFAAVSAFVLSACAPAAAAPAPVQAPAQQQQAAPVVPAATAVPMMPTNAPASEAPAATAMPVQTQAQVPAAATAPLALNIVQNESKATYTAAKTALNRNNRIEDIVGVSPNVNGQINLDLANPANTTVGKITIDVASFNSGSQRRDNDMNREWFNIAQFPVIAFEPQSMEGLPTSAYETGQQLSFKMTGDMTLLDKTAPVTFDVKATFDGNQLIGTATAPLTISSFGIQAPSALGIFSVADDIQVQFDFVAKP